MPEQSSAYLLSEIGGEEAERLRRQAALFLDQELPSVLETLPRDGCFVDLGCGAGVLADAVAARRPDARVHGYDLDPAAVEQSRGHFGGRANLAFGCRALDQGPPEGFPGADAGTLRLVLMHHPDPIEALRRARGWFKPGGVLHVLETDDRALRLEPQPSWMEELLDLMQAVQTRKNGSRRLGLELPRLLAESGWRVEGQRAICLDPRATAAAVPKVFLPVGDLYLNEAERLGVAPGERVRALRAALAELREGRQPLEQARIPVFHAWARIA